MLENVLVKRGCSLRVKLTVKSLVSVGLVVLAVVLPQIVHAVAGANGGVTWLPMYLPVLIGGCLLGTVWGLGIGIASPIVSFAVTAALGNAMPAAARLPYMIVELAVFAAVSGLFEKKIANNGWMAFPAVLLAATAGRITFMLLVVATQSFSSLAPAMAWAQIKTGLVGLTAQAAVVPFIVMGLKKLIDKDNAKQQ